MQPAFWLERWERQQIGFHQTTVNPYLRAHWTDLRVPAATAVFVPMCGKSLDMVWLREQGYEVRGVEISQVAVRDFFSERGLRADVSQDAALERWAADGYVLWCGDYFDLTPAHLEGVGAIFDRASLVALPANMRSRYVRKILETAPAAVQTLLISVSYPQDEADGPPFAVLEPEVRALFEGCRVDKLADVDVLGLEENARFRARGLTQMSEQIYRIAHRS